MPTVRPRFPPFFGFFITIFVATIVLEYLLNQAWSVSIICPRRRSSVSLASIKPATFQKHLTTAYVNSIIICTTFRTASVNNGDLPFSTIVVRLNDENRCFTVALTRALVTFVFKTQCLILSWSFLTVPGASTLRFPSKFRFSPGILNGASTLRFFGILRYLLVRFLKFYYLFKNQTRFLDFGSLSFILFFIFFELS